MLDPTLPLEAEKQINNSPTKPWLFQPGQSGNPKGRPPKGYSIADVWREMLTNKTEVRNKLAQKIIDKALEGDLAAAKIVIEYMDGKPVQPEEVKHDGELNINISRKNE